MSFSGSWERSGIFPALNIWSLPSKLSAVKSTEPTQSPQNLPLFSSQLPTPSSTTRAFKQSEKVPRTSARSGRSLSYVDIKLSLSPPSVLRSPNLPPIPS